MRKSNALFLAAGLSVAATGFALSGMAEATGLDFWVVSDLNDELRRGQRRQVEVEAQLAGTRARTALKEELVADLFRGVRTFDEVVAAFQEINAESPEAIVRLSQEYPNVQVPELSAWNALQFVRTRAKEYGEAGRETLRRVEAEWRLQPSEGGPAPARWEPLR